MNLPIAFRAEATSEFRDAVAWYEGQRRGLGIEFVDEVERALNDIAEQPDRHAVVVGDVRESLVRRFPFCIYYRVRRGILVVLAVFHTSRDPQVWRSRV